MKRFGLTATSYKIHCKLNVLRDNCAAHLIREANMSDDKRRLDAVEAAFEKLASEHGELKPGHLADHFRELGSPIPFWQLRADLTALCERGTIALDATSASYRLT